ncbi:MAG: response regulator [Nitrospirae bacterium]|nr:response regulator [Nitrospirota bacterium]
MVDTPESVSADILIVEDDAQVRAMLRKMLEVAGFRVREATNGKDAMKSWKALRPDLVITDVLMPEMDGFEVITTLRKLDPQSKIIAITGGGAAKLTNLLPAAKHLGASRTLEKPFERDELLKQVRELLQRTA